MKSIRFSPVLLLLIIFAGCKTYKPADKTNISIAYNPIHNKLHPRFTFFHTSKDSSLIYIRQSRKEPARDKYKAARLKFEYQILSSYSTDKVIDSASILIADTLRKNQGLYLERAVKIALPRGNNYIIKTQLNDLVANDYVLDYHEIKKKTAYSRHFFKITDADGNLLYSPLLSENENIRLHYNHASQLHVRYFSKEFQPPRPPYMNSRRRKEPLQTDSIFTIQLNENKSDVLTFNKKGIYHIQADTSQDQGLTLFYFRDHYPHIFTHKQMIPVTRYIATQSEFNDLQEAGKPAEAIDKFWLSITNNQARAKVLIRDYYTRVKQANKLFYTHKPGWKTDRGMFYIVMGPPQLVYRSDDLETWIYGESTKYNALKVNFFKVENPFTENDFSLDRSPTLKDDWFFAIDVWRR